MLGGVGRVTVILPVSVALSRTGVSAVVVRSTVPVQDKPEVTAASVWLQAVSAPVRAVSAAVAELAAAVAESAACSTKGVTYSVISLVIAVSVSLSGTWDSFSLLFVSRVAIPLGCPTPASFAVVTELSASLVVVTELSASFGVVMELS